MAGAVSLLKVLIPAGIFAGMADPTAILAKTLSYKRIFRLLSRTRTSPRIRLGGSSFQKIKQPLRNPPVFVAKLPHLCVAQ